MTSDLYPDFRSQCCICHNNNTLFYLCLILYQLLTEYRHKFSTDYKSIAVIEQGTFHKFDVCFPDISLTTYCQTLPTCIAYWSYSWFSMCISKGNRDNTFHKHVSFTVLSPLSDVTSNPGKSSHSTMLFNGFRQALLREYQHQRASVKIAHSKDIRKR